MFSLPVYTSLFCCTLVLSIKSCFRIHPVKNKGIELLSFHFSSGLFINPFSFLYLLLLNRNLLANSLWTMWLLKRIPQVAVKVQEKINTLIMSLGVHIAECNTQLQRMGSKQQHLILGHSAKKGHSIRT